MPIPDAPINPVDNQTSVNPNAPLDDFNYKASSKKSGSTLKYGLALVALVAVVGGILAFSQSALRQSQETRSDAAFDDPPIDTPAPTATPTPAIWIGFYDHNGQSSTIPTEITSIAADAGTTEEVALMLNNPNRAEITSGAVFIEYFPSHVESVTMDIPSQTGIKAAPVVFYSDSYNDTKDGVPTKIAVMKFAASCANGIPENLANYPYECYPLKNTINGTNTGGSPYLKHIDLVNVKIKTKAGVTGTSQIRVVMDTDGNDTHSRSMLLVKGQDVLLDKNAQGALVPKGANMLKPGGFITLNLNFGGGPDNTPTPTSPGTGTPAKVEGFTATPNTTARTVVMSWNAAANAAKYQVYRCKVVNSKCVWGNVNRDITTTTYTQADVANGNYRYKVRGINGTVNGAWSSTVNVAMTGTGGASPTPTGAAASPTPTEVAGTKPAKVAGLNVNPVCSMQKNELSWTAAARATAYAVRYCKGGSCTPNNSLTSTLTTTTYVHQNLTAGLYRYQVRATNAVGSGAWSDVKQGRIDADCTQVTPTATSAASTPTPTTPFAPTEGPTATQTPAQLAGDFNLDGNVSLAELQRVMDAYGQTGNVPENVNTDNEVNLLDVTIVLANFLR